MKKPISLDQVYSFGTIVNYRSLYPPVADNRLFLSFSGIVTSAKKHGSIFHLIPKKTKVHKLVVSITTIYVQLYPDSSEEIIVPRQHCDHLEGIDGYIQSNTLTLLLGVTYFLIPLLLAEGLGILRCSRCYLVQNRLLVVRLSSMAISCSPLHYSRVML